MKPRISYRGNDRYQYQSWRIKVYRQIKYRPIFFLGWIWATIMWLLRGAPMEEIEAAYGPITRWQAVKGGLRMRDSIAAYEMGHYFTLDECKADLGI